MFWRRKRRRAPVRRVQRRRSRLVPVTGFVLVCVGLAWFFEQQATTTIIFVRHTDTAIDAGVDAPLSRLGQQRAELLADVIQDIDVVAGVDAIYASEHRHTQETAAAVAGRLELDVSIRDPYEVVPFMAQVLRQHKGEIVLIVTLGDALAPLVEELHGSKNIPTFGPDDYDDIYIVTIPWFGKVKTLRMHYGFYEPPGAKLPSLFSSSDDVL
ncbi:MAG: phosphoglycerate mutase family protein [Rhodospirillaceae bacterium]|nr:phosphoglycerate mutase family protein [Rhodospirillaceae bacterium]